MDHYLADGLHDVRFDALTCYELNASVIEMSRGLQLAKGMLVIHLAISVLLPRSVLRED